MSGMRKNIWNRKSACWIRKTKKRKKKDSTVRRGRRKTVLQLFPVSGPCTVFIMGTRVHHMVLERVNSSRCFHASRQPPLEETGASKESAVGDGLSQSPSWRKAAVSGLFCVLLDYNSNRDNGTDERPHCFSAFSYKLGGCQLFLARGDVKMVPCFNGYASGDKFSKTLAWKNLLNVMPEQLRFGFSPLKQSPCCFVYVCVFSCNLTVCSVESHGFGLHSSANCKLHLPGISTGKMLWVCIIGELRQYVEPVQSA